jgi:hypothetical protein
LGNPRGIDVGVPAFKIGERVSRFLLPGLLEVLKTQDQLMAPAELLDQVVSKVLIKPADVRYTCRDRSARPE